MMFVVPPTFPKKRNQLSKNIMQHVHPPPLKIPELPPFSGCIFSKPRAFGESSSESEGSDVGKSQWRRWIDGGREGERFSTSR